MDISLYFDWGFSLLTLTALELVLGIDNIILLSLLVETLPKEQQGKARFIGLSLAVLFRVMLLMMITFIIRLKEPLFSIVDHPFSVRDLILLGGGLFLLAKATTEIFKFVETQEEKSQQAEASSSSKFAMVIIQVIIFDMIFSLDSVLTAVGLAKEINIMIIAVLLAAILMVIFAKTIGDFVEANPAIKMLALSFLAMIGVLLVAEGWGSHFDRGYVYFSMAFSLGIELLNKRRRRQFQSKF